MQIMQSQFSNSGSVIQAKKIGDVLHTETTFVHFHTASLSAQPSSLCFPRPDINFVGRLDELTFSKTKIIRQPHIIVICGLGGVGKTQLVRKFIDENKSSYKNVIWINAQERALIEENFKTLARHSLNISIECEGKQRDFNTIIQEIFNKLSATPTLIVLDNVDNKDDIKFVLTMGTLGEVPHVIITSRIRGWNISIDRIFLDVFNTTDAIEYVSRTLFDNECQQIDSQEQKNSLVEKLQKFPLALRQATAYISNERVEEDFSIDDFISEYNKQHVLDSKIFQDESNEYAETTFTTWRVTLAKIGRSGPRGDLALRILRIIAFFNPDHIRRDIFFNLELPGTYIEPSEVKSAVRLLVDYSMVDSKKPQSVLSIHRLVQQVIRIELENVADMTETILRDGLSLIWRIGEHKNFHEIHEHGAPIFLSAVKFHPLAREFSSFAISILESFIVSRKFIRAVYFGDEILKPLETVLGKEHSTTIFFKFRIAYAYGSIGKNSEALQIHQEVYEQRKNILGDDHPDTLASKTYVARTYGKIGKHSEALRLNEEVYVQRKIILGVDHPDTLTSKNNVAFSYGRIGNHYKALQMHQEAYEQRKIILGDDHLDTLTSKNNMASSYNQIGKYSEALRIHVEVYEQKKIVLGNDHPQTLISKNNIARTYGHIGKHHEALRMHQEEYEESKNILGYDDPDTLISKNNIACSYGKIGEHSEALRMHQEVHEQRTNILGADHPDTLTSKSYVASSYSKIGEHPKAFQMHLEVHDQRTNILGADHPDTLTSKSYVASSYSKIGEHSEALRMHQEVFEQRTNILGTDHPDTLKTLPEGRTEQMPETMKEMWRNKLVT